MYNDFTPDYSITGTDTLSPFQVWCQKVLPTIYDNSLSYYELLTKVVKYLNDTMMNVNDLSKDMGELNKAYQQLVTYINSFKDYADGRMDGQDEKIADLTEKYENFQRQVEYLIHEQDQKINKFVYTDAPALINAEVQKYTETDEFAEKVSVAVNESLQESGTLPEITEINTKIGTSIDSQTVFQDLESLKTSVDGLEESIGTISVTGIDEIDTKIGNTNDSQASETDGTVMGKLNLLIKSGGGGGGGGSDAQVQSIVDNIGATGDSDGTATAGTIFAKENAIITKTADISTRVGYTDQAASTTGSLMQRTKFIANTVNSINSVQSETSTFLYGIGTTTDSGATATTGTLMGKVNTLLEGGSGGSGIWGNGKPFNFKTINTADASTTATPINGSGYAILTFNSNKQSGETGILHLKIDGNTFDVSTENLWTIANAFTFYFNTSFEVLTSNLLAVSCRGYVFYQEN